MAAEATSTAPTSDELKSILTTAKLAANKAGELIMANKGAVAVAHTKDGDKDLVTLIDKQCEEVIKATIAAAFPSHSVLGEESVPSGSAASAAALESFLSKEWLWIVDPIDGTTNFVHGMPASVVSIGVAHNGKVVVGVIFDPFRGEMFSASLGGGAFCNEDAISVSQSEKSIGQALVAFGTGRKNDMALTMLGGAGAVAEICRSVRSFGSAALHLSWVACGRLTAFWELDLSSWDITAGSLLVTEAGGCVSDARGGSFSLRTRDMLASTGVGDIHDSIVRVLAASGTHVVPGKTGNSLYPPAGSAKRARSNAAWFLPGDSA